MPESARARLAEVKEGLKAGAFHIWQGPIADNTGKQVLAEGQVADDAFLGGINFFVEGVEGQAPGQ